MLDLSDPGTLLHGDNNKTAELLKIKPITVKRWKQGIIKLPEPVRLLMYYIKWGEIAGIGGKEWEGFKIGWQDKLLYIPGWKYGFDPWAIKAMFFKVQLIDHLKRELKFSEEELKETQLKLIEAQKNSEYYREQLKQAEKNYIYNVLQ